MVYGLCFGLLGDTASLERNFSLPSGIPRGVGIPLSFILDNRARSGRVTMFHFWTGQLVRLAPNQTDRSEIRTGGLLETTNHKEGCSIGSDDDGSEYGNVRSRSPGVCGRPCKVPEPD